MVNILNINRSKDVSSMSLHHIIFWPYCQPWTALKPHMSVMIKREEIKKETEKRGWKKGGGKRTGKMKFILVLISKWG